MPCKRCGKCCYTTTQRQAWNGGDLTWEEKQYAIKERRLKPAHTKGGCEMLWFESDNTAHCFIEDLFGRAKKDGHCARYPNKGTECVNKVVHSSNSEDINIT